MHARFVYEAIEFERGKDPKRSMDIGLSKAVVQKLEEILKEDGEDELFILSINFYDGDGVEFVVDEIYEPEEDYEDGKSERDRLEEILRGRELDKIFNINKGMSQHQSGVIRIIYPFKEGLEGTISDSVYLWDPSEEKIKVQTPSKRPPTELYYES